MTGRQRRTGKLVQSACQGPCRRQSFCSLCPSDLRRLGCPSSERTLSTVSVGMPRVSVGMSRSGRQTSRLKATSINPSHNHSHGQRACQQQTLLILVATQAHLRPSSWLMNQRLRRQTMQLRCGKDEWHRQTMASMSSVKAVSTWNPMLSPRPLVPLLLLRSRGIPCMRHPTPKSGNQRATCPRIPSPSTQPSPSQAFRQPTTAPATSHLSRP